MNRIRLLGFLLAVGCLLAFAEEFDIDGAFLKQKPDGSPAGWQLNNWVGYRPLATMTLLKGADGGRNVLRVEQVTAERGAGVNSVTRVPGRCGDVVRLSFRVRGKGQGHVDLGMMTADGKWISTAKERYNFKMTAGWGDHLCSLRLNNGKTAGETAQFYVMFACDQASEMEFSSVKVDREESLYRGSEPFPVKWTVFGEVAKDYEPTAGELTSLPTTFNGVQPVVMNLVDNILDFAKVMPTGVGVCGWAFAELNSPIECDYTFGAGADWWMKFYVNGQVLFDTMAEGNKKSPVSFTNYVKTVRLKAGSNIIAVKFLSGKASSKLKMSGPQALQNIVKKVKLSKISWIDMFDNGKTATSGKPELIQGHPTPGLLTLTGQALYKTSGQVDILPPQRVYDIPEAAYEYLALSVRLQNFGREETARKDAELTFAMAEAGETFSVKIKHSAGSGMLGLDVIGGTGLLAHHEVPYRLLPAGVMVAGSREGRYSITVNSLVDMSTQQFTGNAPFFATHGKASVGMSFKALAPEAELVIDNYLVGIASEESRVSRVPFIVNPQPEFDPVKAGWKLVFDDEFDGDTVNLDKWSHRYASIPERVKIHDGLAEIICDWDEKHTKVTSASIGTKEVFGYGYFECRVKFRKEHGWWAAFWLYGLGQPSNPFYDAFEIDIFEDYYLRPLVPGGEPRDVLDHNLHMHVGDAGKSWNYNSKLPGSLDDFYVIGCKWTPFEITYYLNGKAIRSSAAHSPYDCVTFDPFNHATGITPLSAILSGCVHSKSGGDPKDGHFPESFFVDYVRIYAYPQDADPAIKYVNTKRPTMYVDEGTELNISVEVAPNQTTKSPIKAVYLLDSGYLLEYKTKPPYDFKVLFTKEYFDTTDYVRPGKQGVVPNFRCGMHAFAVFVQDELGNVAHTEAITTNVNAAEKSRPYQGKPQVIPGVVELTRFDEGGQLIAYYDNTKGNAFFKDGGGERPDEDVDFVRGVIGGIAPMEWLNYTVDVKAAGRYRVVLNYGTPQEKGQNAILFMGTKELGRFSLVRHESSSWAVDEKAETIVELPAGQYILRLLTLTGGFNASTLEFKKVDMK